MRLTVTDSLTGVSDHVVLTLHWEVVTVQTDGAQLLVTDHSVSCAVTGDQAIHCNALHLLDKASTPQGAEPV